MGQNRIDRSLTHDASHGRFGRVVQNRRGVRHREPERIRIADLVLQLIRDVDDIIVRRLDRIALDFARYLRFLGVCGRAFRRARLARTERLGSLLSRIHDMMRLKRRRQVERQTFRQLDPIKRAETQNDRGFARLQVINALPRPSA